MGVCFHGVLRIVLSDLPQVAEVAEIAEEKKSCVKPFSNFEVKTLILSLANLPLQGSMNQI